MKQQAPIGVGANRRTQNLFLSRTVEDYADFFEGD
jgi:hypothetical protein